MKEIKVDLNKWKYIPCSRIAKLNCQDGDTSRRSADLTQSLSKLQLFFADIDKLVLKFTWNVKGTRITTAISKNCEVGGFTVLITLATILQSRRQYSISTKTDMWINEIELRDQK